MNWTWKSILGRALLVVGLAFLVSVQVVRISFPIFGIVLVSVSIMFAFLWLLWLANTKPTRKEEHDLRFPTGPNPTTIDPKRMETGVFYVFTIEDMSFMVVKRRDGSIDFFEGSPVTSKEAQG